MPILRRAVEFGGAAAILSIGAKALGRHEQTRHEHKLQLQQQQQQPWSTPNSSYRHQPYCDGRCGERCNGVGSNYQHQPHCDGTCGGRCNGVGSAARYVSPQPPPPPQQYLEQQGQNQALSGARGGPAVGGDYDAVLPSYEYQSPRGGEASLKARDGKS
jgi:hypothetical protein